MAKKLGIARSTLSYYEHGSIEPNIFVLISLSKLMNCSLDNLIGLNKEKIIPMPFENNKYPETKTKETNEEESEKTNDDLSDENINATENNLIEDLLKNLKKSKKNCDDLESSKSRADKMYEEFRMSKSRADKMFTEFQKSKQRTDKMYEEFEISKKRNDRIYEDLKLARKRTDQIYNELDMSKKRVDRMFNELELSKKRADRMFNELSRTINRENFINKTFNKFETEIKDNICYFLNKSRKLELLEEEAKGNNYVGFIKLNILGKISAGLPHYACEDLIDTVYLPNQFFKPNFEYFGLRIFGDSMNKMFDNDFTIVVRKTNSFINGDIVIAIIGDEATCKEIKQVENYIYLIPHSTNPDHQIQKYQADQVIILGVVEQTIKSILDKIDI